jgi:hypothetical protein
MHVCSSLFPFCAQSVHSKMQFTFPTCLSSRCYTPSSFIPPLFPIPFCTFFMSVVYTLLSPILPSLFSNFPFFLIFSLLTVSPSQSLFNYLLIWSPLSTPLIPSSPHSTFFRPFSFNSFVFSVPLVLSYYGTATKRSITQRVCHLT